MSGTRIIIHRAYLDKEPTDYDIFVRQPESEIMLEKLLYAGWIDGDGNTREYFDFLCGTGCENGRHFIEYRAVLTPRA